MKLSDSLTLDDANAWHRGRIQLTVMADPIRNRAKVSFLFRENGTNNMYIADFSDLKFTKIEDPISVSGNANDHIAVCADLLHVAADQILYAAGLNGLCKTSENERDAFKAHISSLEKINDRLMNRVDAAPVGVKANA